MDLDRSDSPSMISSRKDHTPALAEEHGAIYVRDESATDQDLAEPEAPAISQARAAEPETIDRRSEPQAQSRQTTSVVQPTAYHRGHRHSPVNLGVEDLLTRPLSQESTRPTSGCISLANGPEAELGSFGSEKCSDELRTADTTQDLESRPHLQQHHQQPRDIFRTTAFQKPASLSTANLSRDSDLTALRSSIDTSKNQAPTIASTRYTRMSKATSSEEMFQTTHSPLFPLHAAARSIFSGKDKEPEEPEKLEKPHKSETVIAAQKTSVAMNAPVTAQAEAGSWATISRDTMMQNRTVRTTSHSETLLADNPRQSAPHVSTPLDIIRLCRQDPSPVKNSSTLVAPMSTPQAFLQHLHAPTSPIVGTHPSPDTPKRQNPPRVNSVHVGKGCVDKRRPSPYDTVPFTLNMSRRQMPPSSGGSGSEADHSTLAHTHQRDRGDPGSANKFASMVEENMLDVVLVSAIDSM